MPGKGVPKAGRLAATAKLIPAMFVTQWPSIRGTFLGSGTELRHTRAEWMYGQHTFEPGGLAWADLGWGVSAWPNCSASGSMSSSEKAASTPWVFAAATCSQPPMSTT